VEHKLKMMKETWTEEWKKEIERLEEQLNGLRADLATLTGETEDEISKVGDKPEGDQK